MAEHQHWSRQGITYGLVGAAQFALDWTLFAALHALSGASALPNVIARVGGALLGFALNSRYTFGGSAAPLVGRRLRRFMAMWLLQTAVSTVLVWAAAQHLPPGWVYGAKPVIELALAGAGFVAWRYWIARG